MASRVMPLRALAGAAASLAVGLSLMTAPAGAATVAAGSPLAPVARASLAVAPTSVSPTVVAARAVYLGEPLATRNRAVPYSLRGVFPSAYIGRYFDRRFEAKRRCIVQRESNGIYTALGGYYGAYQFGGAWHTGLIAMMRPSLSREVGATLAGRLLAPLYKKPVNRWSRYWQDRAFWTVFNHGSGASNWAGGGYPC